MAGKRLVFLLGIFFIVLLFSCAKLPDESSTGSTEYSFAMKQLPMADTIPLNWGELVTVSSVSLYPGWVQLWFHDKEGNVYMVPYDVQVKKFSQYYRYLKRK